MTMYTRTRIFWLLVLVLFCLQISVSSAGEKDTPPGKDFSGVVFENNLLRVRGTSEPRETRNDANVSGNMQMVFDKGVLSVSLHDADLEEVLKEISRQSNIRINFYGHIKERVTFQFRNVPLERALKRLLKNQNYSFSYARRKGMGEKKTQYVLSRVFLLGKSTSSQRENRQSRAIPEGTHLSQNVSLSEISADVIKDLSRQRRGGKGKFSTPPEEGSGRSLKAVKAEHLEILFGEGERGKVKGKISEEASDFIKSLLGQTHREQGQIVTPFDEIISRNPNALNNEEILRLLKKGR